jgi:hypothetical protein
LGEKLAELHGCEGDVHFDSCYFESVSTQTPMHVGGTGRGGLNQSPYNPCPQRGNLNQSPSHTIMIKGMQSKEAVQEEATSTRAQITKFMEKAQVCEKQLIFVWAHYTCVV